MPRLKRYYCYLLLSERGEVYCGFTPDIRRRFKEHNSSQNTGWTRGRRWHLLAVKCFLDDRSALLFERWVKKRPSMRPNWIKQERRRLRELCRRHSITHKLA